MEERKHSVYKRYGLCELPARPETPTRIPACSRAMLYGADRPEIRGPAAELDSTAGKLFAQSRLLQQRSACVGEGGARACVRHRRGARQHRSGLECARQQQHHVCVDGERARAHVHRGSGARQQQRRVHVCVDGEGARAHVHRGSGARQQQRRVCVRQQLRGGGVITVRLEGAVLRPVWSRVARSLHTSYSVPLAGSYSLPPLGTWRVRRWPSRGTRVVFLEIALSFARIDPAPPIYYPPIYDYFGGAWHTTSSFCGALELKNHLLTYPCVPTRYHARGRCRRSETKDH